MTRKQQKQEALKRMKKIGFMDDVIHQFKNEDVVFYSERQNNIFNAVLYWTSNDNELTKRIKEFEEKNNALVYHVQLTHMEFGEMYSFLFVSNYEEEWEYDMQDLEDGQCLAYVWNKTMNNCSEFGTIGIQPSMGGVVRTW